MADKHQIVIVGGGAGGLELATKLGDGLGRKSKAEITLIDAKRTHLWKPLLHQVAAGSLSIGDQQLEYLAQARWRHFRFRLGKMCGLDRRNRLVIVAPTLNEKGEEVIPQRSFHYDSLVIAVGSVSNDFGIKGVQEHCLFLDTLDQAQRFQQHLLNRMLYLHTHKRRPDEQLGVAIIGAGATGVELAAQLHTVTRVLSAYGLDELHPEQDIKLHIIEAGPRILPALPEPVMEKTCISLEKLGVQIHVNERVVEVTKDGVKTAKGDFIPAGITVWAAGIKGPDFLRDIDGLETNRINQLVVKTDLQTTRDENIYALGDCAACPDKSGGIVPPRAQAAHQQASFLYKVLSNRLKGVSRTECHDEYQYRDYGSLVTLGSYSTVGSLMGNIPGTLFITGYIARLVYLSLYKMHQIALYGWLRTALLTFSKMLRRSVDPEVKLH
ncbi:MAG: NAD(P)/FAD-dependent oxidoreductase [Gammaproteobacteria bacterium]